MTSRAPMVPGPTVIGIARGTTATSSFESCGETAALPWSMATAERNSTAPAPIRKASRVMPNSAKI
ncbi:MAG: hypothetical protein ACD_75C01908G0001 [uncultured bacterium]|nr:MAG: hypothetical protein ACD_75C01908G0001 [uncultured bacterium]